MEKPEATPCELHEELQKTVGPRATMLMERLLATKEDIHHLELKMEVMEARLEARYLRTILMVNVPSILGAVGLSFAATRLG